MEPWRPSSPKPAFSPIGMCSRSLSPIGGRDDLELSPAHPLAYGDCVFLFDRPAPIDIGRLDLADSDDIGAQLLGLLFQVSCGVFRRAQIPTLRRDGAIEAGVLVLVDLLEPVVGGVAPVRATTRGRVPFFPGKGRR
jgi:hypothetical protein